MGKFVALLIIFSCSVFSQETEESGFLSSFKIGFYGGINFRNLSETGYSLIIEGRTSLTSSLNLRASIGYSRTYMKTSYHVDTYAFRSVQNIDLWEAISYDVNEKGYDIIPFTLGFQYLIIHKTISPYILGEFSYNSIATKFYTSSRIHQQFSSFDELPEKFKVNHKETIINSSNRFGLGFGALWHLSESLDLDIRYAYLFDNKVINTNQILIGISLN